MSPLFISKQTITSSHSDESTSKNYDFFATASNINKRVRTANHLKKKNRQFSSCFETAVPRWARDRCQATFGRHNLRQFALQAAQSDQKKHPGKSRAMKRFRFHFPTFRSSMTMAMATGRSNVR